MAHVGNPSETSFRYPGQTKVVIKECSLDITPGTRIVFLGPNGCGKTTLLNLLTGTTSPTAGEVYRHSRLRLGYFSQDAVDALTPSCTPVAEMMARHKGLKERECFAHLGAVGVTGDIAPHILVPDEITNHLDMGTVEKLAEALQGFSGALILVSHDVWFLRDLMEHVDEDENGDDAEDVGKEATFYSVGGARVTRWEGGLERSWKAGCCFFNNLNSAKSQALQYYFMIIFCHSALRWISSGYDIHIWLITSAEDGSEEAVVPGFSTLCRGPLSELLTVNRNLYERSSFVCKRVRATPVYILLNGLIAAPVHWFYRCLMVYEIRVWGLFAYRIAMDAIMIKRVHAMYHGSRSILILLVSCCIAKTMVVFILLMLSIGPMSGFQYLEGNIGNTSICSTQPKVGLMMLSNIPPLCFEVLLFVLVARCFLIHALERRRQWNRWKLSDLMRIMARDNTIYFILILAASALNAGNWKQTENFYGAFSASLVTSIPFILVPRLVVNFKDYFEHEDRVHVCTEDAGNLADSDPTLGGHSLLVFRTERDSVGCTSAP
ncbi:hypothetical protein HYDPIDRAFT_27971 [Hydnomerulius pinastri MD-312]|uniref:ABC transporter domain-containing protein n=1 Tax=Hydnomerulius pinastri MD-312 TaxID=994086 RepID=A0A0C9WFY5_9AGAM|nr:hypothetical protein HYDPIDRAFT_27971 [Hydnomerulius pinastri MD-312]